MRLQRSRRVPRRTSGEEEPEEEPDEGKEEEEEEGDHLDQGSESDYDPDDNNHDHSSRKRKKKKPARGQRLTRRRLGATAGPSGEEDVEMSAPDGPPPPSKDPTVIQQAELERRVMDRLRRTLEEARQSGRPLQLADDGRRFQDGSGALCTHPTPDPAQHGERPPPPPPAAGSPHAVVDTSCTILRHVGMFYCHLLRTFACQVCALLVPRNKDDLVRHFKAKRHRATCRHLAGNGQLRVLFGALATHLLAGFGPPVVESSAAMSDRLRKEPLEHRLPGFPDPILCIRCEGCLGWFLQRAGNYPLAGIQIHQRESKEESCRAARKRSYEDYEKAYTVELLRLGTESFSMTRVVAAYQNPPAGRVPPALSAAPPPPPPPPPPPLRPYHPQQKGDLSVPPFFEDLGWSRYLAETDLDWEVVRALVRRPKAGFPRTSLMTRRERTVERGLHAVHDFLTLYLQSASEGVGTSHDYFRSSLRKGW